MAYDAPTAAQFKERFPAFASVADFDVENALSDAARRVDETWAEGDFARARMLYAAHVLVLDGQGTGREVKLSGFKRIKIGSLELERAGDTSAGSLSSTSYGQRFLELMRLNFAGGGVTG